MGILYIVSTPIGNLKDITLRALEVLSQVDYILCEDTRVSGRLFSVYKISGKMVPFNDINEDAKTPLVISDLAGGKNIALVSDAGTPLISDPGFKLVRECIEKGIKVESIPGPAALISALTVSGLPPDRFIFLGYLPKKDGKREKLFSDLKELLKKLKSTVIFYESPFRLLRSLKDVESIFGDIDVVACRELTKLHEEIRKAKVSEQIEHFSITAPRGEFVILF